MLRKTRSGGRRALAGSIAVAVAVSVSALTAAGSGAEVAAQKQGKIDKSAVLRIGSPINDSGGVAFDPSASSLSPYVDMYGDLIYDTMARKTVDGELVPQLATKWTIVDPSTLELTLRDGVKFTDGAPFNAAAVKAAYDRHLVYANTPGSGATTPPEVKAITSVEAVNDHNIRLHFNQPVAKVFVQEQLNTARWLGVPSPAPAAAGTLNQKPVGAGPYMLKSYASGQDVVLTKNPDYWNPKAQKLGGVEFTHLLPGVPATSALQAGAVDMIFPNPPPDAVETIQRTNGLEITARPGTRVQDLGLCVSKGPFANKQARQALQYAIDRDAINEAVFSGTATPAQVVLSPSHPFYNAKLNKTYKYNPKKARELLQQAGVAPGTTVQMYVSTQPPNPTMAEVVQAQLQKVGLNVVITQTSNLPADAARVLPDITPAFIEPAFFSIAFERVSTLNVCNWSNPEFSAAFAVTKDSSKSEVEQKAAWDKLQQILLDESPDIFYAAIPLLVAHTDNVRGVGYVSGAHGPDVRTIYKVK